MAVTYAAWAAETSYTSGQRALYDGIVYETLDAVTGSVDNSTPDQDVANWRISSIRRIQSYHSLQAAIQLEINTTDEMINESIPLFVQLAESSFQTRVRAPVQRCAVILTVDDQSRVEIPGDLLQVVNMRIESDDAAGDSLIARGGTEILAGNYEEYRDLQRFHRSSFGFVNRRASPTNYDAPVYWFDSTHFWIAPDLAEGTEIELYYYAVIPALGTEVFLVNDDGEPVNSAGQTLAEWIIADSNNTVDNFVQDSVLQEVNWFIQAAPQMLLYGALTQAASYLVDDARVPMWQERFVAAEQETMDLIQRFEEGRHHTQQIYNAYSV